MKLCGPINFEKRTVCSWCSLCFDVRILIKLLYESTTQHKCVEGFKNHYSSTCVAEKSKKDARSSYMESHSRPVERQTGKLEDLEGELGAIFPFTRGGVRGQTESTVETVEFPSSFSSPNSLKLPVVTKRGKLDDRTQRARYGLSGSIDKSSVTTSSSDENSWEYQDSCRSLSETGFSAIISSKAR